MEYLLVGLVLEYYGGYMGRFKDLDWGYAVEDTVTGKRYTEYDFHNGEVTKLLNDVNDRADRNAEKYLAFLKVLDKYDIGTVEKLDQVLFNQRVW